MQSTTFNHCTASSLRSAIRSGMALVAFAILSFTLIAAAPSVAPDINTVAGGVTPSNVATALDLPRVASAIEDPTGSVLYVASPDSYYIFQVNLSTGAATVIAGNGTQGYKGDGVPATSATLGGPTSLVLDSTGNLYFVDLQKIRKIDTNGTITTFAGTGQVCQSGKQPCGDGGPATSAQFDTPQQIALDGAGNMYVADTKDQRVRIIDSTGNIHAFAGTGYICSGPNFKCGDGGPATSAQLDLPAGVVADSNGNVYIADTRDQRVRVVNSGTINTIFGSGDHCQVPTEKCGDGGPAGKAKLWNPWGLALDSQQNVYIADQFDNRIREVTISNMIINTVVGSGVQGFGGDGGPPKSAELDEPNGVFVDKSGNIDVSDTGNNRARIAANGVINTVAGGWNGGDGGVPLSATLGNPSAVAWDSSGNYYIADTANNRVRYVNNSTNLISTFAGNGSEGFSGDGGQATQAMLSRPTGVTLDSSGNVYIADLGNLRVRMVNPSGVISTIAGDGKSCFPTTDSCGDGGPATSAYITGPTTVAIGSNGNIYIADYYDHRIRMVDTSGNISTVAGTGKKGYNGDGHPATSALLKFPYGVALDSEGNIYIADSQNNRIRCVLEVSGGCGGSKLEVGDITTYAFNGDATFGGDGGPATSASQQVPLEVTFDGSGDLYVSGGADEVVRLIGATAPYNVSTIAGDALHPLRTGFSGDGGPATKATLNDVGVAINASGDLIIADQGNNRIRQVDLNDK